MPHTSRLVFENYRYTGSEDVIPPSHHARKTTLAVLGTLDQAAEIGANYEKLPQVQQAREVAARVTDLRKAYRGVADDAASAMSTLGEDFAAGILTPDQVVDRATDAAVLTGSLETEARRHVENAAAAAERAGAALFREITEDQWLAPLRPVISDLIAEANETSDRIGIEQPRPQMMGVHVHTHNWAPTDKQLNRDVKLRHAWELLLDVLARLDQAHSIATELRRQGCLPLAPNRHWNEDYRWLHRGQLAGNPTHVREFWLANRNGGAQPGIYTAAEMAEAETATATSATRARQQGVDAFTRLAI